jgi:hypothetical protein
MKTVEEKAKAYDEFLKRAKELYNKDHYKSEDLKYIFGDDLKEENEEEKLIETLINFFTSYKIEKVGEFTSDQIVGWLKEQLEEPEKYEWSGKITSRKAKGKLSALLKDLESRKKIDNRPIFRIGDTLKKKGKDYTFTVDRIQGGYYHCDRNNGAFFPIEEQYDWELIDDGKISPKFKAGDWIVSPNNLVFKITHASSHSYTLHLYSDDYRIFETESWHIDKEYHLWTIADAKPGDVLYHSDSASHGIFIFKGILQMGFSEKVTCYCDYDSEDGFCIGENHTCCWTDSKILHPATKEQQKILFQKMKEAGWTWDDEKKELEQKSIDEAESEFKIGDWITFYGYKPLKILKIEPEQSGILDYLLLNLSGHDTYYNKRQVDKKARLWTIEDAKDGDVLASHECYVRFKEIDGPNIRCYCTYHYMNDPSFSINTLHNKSAFHPATKEECELLFQKAKEEGYEWDKEHKNSETENETVEKFIVGKWYLCIKDFFGKGVRFDKGIAYYCAKEGCLQCEYGCHIAIVKDLYDYFKLWTIEDAKDGDVLVSTWKGNQYIYIFKNIEQDAIISYIYYCPKFDEVDIDAAINMDNIPTVPATKEQQELLFSKIKDEGYEWDDENKKIEPKDVELDEWLSNLDKEIKDFVTTDEFDRDSATGGHYWAIAKHAFLLGAKKMCQETIDWFEQKCFSYASEEENPAKKSIQWLKSLKQRMEN